ncbi:uncharacterized protein LOC127005730 [Eriocheir sinensis]|uniref:uncharacterized protein LOC127005730 n=1 Tax=Eriocheir sinensis TaxID=95602 RepID=UPI0021C8451A|nr:uncharacterized protein LOC127005730 [Eriocheir sinensis]
MLALTAAARAAVIVGATVGLLIPQKDSSWPLGSVLEEIVAGPLLGWPLVVYMDSHYGPATSLWARSGLSEVPRVLVDLTAEGAEWCERQTEAALRAEDTVHLVLLNRDWTGFFRQVAAAGCGWRPSYLLLVDATSGVSPANLLREEAFSRVVHLALLRPLPQSSAPPAVYSLFPYARFISKVFHLSYIFLGQVRRTGSWRAGTPLHGLFADRFPNFEGCEFHLATWLDDHPYLYPEDDIIGNDPDGLQVEVLNALGHVLNFTYTMTQQPPDDNWGTIENGSWTGMLGMVHRGEKDFTVNFFGYTLEKMQDFDASSSYWMEGFGLTLRAPPPLPRWRAAYYPFRITVWLCGAGAFMLVVALWGVQGGCSGGKSGPGWLYLLRPLLNSSLPRLPTSLGLRVFFATWSLSAYILTTAYTANLIAFLTVPAFPPRLKTIEDLAQSSFRVTMSDYGEFVPEALRSSPNENYLSLGRKLDLFYEYNRVLPHMKRGTHAFLESYAYSSILLVLSDYDLRETYMLKEQLYPAHLCWYFRKDSPWKHKIDEGLTRLVEAGLVEEWLKIKTSDLVGRGREAVEVGKGRKDSPLSLQHLQAAFLLLLLLSAISVLVFVIEVLLRCC